MNREKMAKKNILVPATFSAGFAREVVNPLPGTALGGWATASKRLSETVADDICVTCTAMSDGKEVFLFYSHDALYVKGPMVDQLCDWVEKEFGIPKDNVVMNATHSHSAPILHYPKMAGMPEYMERYWPALYRITEKAIRDLAPATLLAGKSETENLNFVRRYVSLEDGSYLGKNIPKDSDPKKVRHETEADPELQVLRLAREGKKDILLMNWQCHPCTYPVGAEKGTMVSADFVGALRDALEEDLNVHFSYHQGCAGNLSSGSRIAGIHFIYEYKAKGRALAEYAKKAFLSAKRVKTGAFQAKRVNFTATHNERYKEKEKVGDTDSLYLNVLSIGDVAFATAPCEWHDTCGKTVKENSPFEMTFICAYTNGTVSYIPSALAFDNGGYETKMCHFVRGTGEAIAEELLKRLEEIR